MLSSRREDVLANVRSQCANPDRHLVLPLDMFQTESFATAVQSVLKRFGRIDILIHCAGISQRGTAIDTELKVDRHLMDLNYFGPVALTKNVLPSMLARRPDTSWSSAACSASLPCRNGPPMRRRSTRCMAFSMRLRSEVDCHGVAVTLVCPGFVRSNASFNALEGDGTAHNKMDLQIANGLPSDVCARKITRAIERRARKCTFAAPSESGCI